jgi:hypothetical protein
MSSYPVLPPEAESDESYFIPTYDKDVELKPNYFCRARNVKREKYCRARAGQGTTHLGMGRCRNHGGSTPIKHGRYSETIRGTMGEHLDRLELEDEEDKLDIMPEAQLLRAITMNVSEKFVEFTDAIIAWNDEEASEAKVEERRPKFLNVPDLKDLADLAKKTAEIVNMEKKNRAANAISFTDFNRLMVAMAESVDVEIDRAFDRHINAGQLEQEVIDQCKSKIQEAWRTIKLKS